MLTLTVQVPEVRDRTALAALRSGLKTIATGPAVASAIPAIAAQRGNPACDPLRPWGHPALGGYRLLLHRATRPDQSAEYGGHFLLFEPVSGAALSAESYGRLGLLAYGGAAGRDRRMRRTQGGLRLSNQLLQTVVARLDAGEDMMLRLETLAAPAWWQFWKQPAKTQPLSDTTVAALTPPADELSIVEQLLAAAPRRPRPERSEDRDTGRRDDRDSSRSRSDDGYEGRGGEFAGGGASGGWGDTSGARGPGVDQAGRIAAGVAAGAVLGGIAGHAAAAARGENGAGSESTDASPSDGGSGSDTTTGTAY